ADGAGALAGWIRRVKVTARLHRECNIQIHYTRLQHGALVFQVYFENPVHSRETNRNTGGTGDRAAAQSCACAPPHQRHSILTADLDDGDDVLGRARKYDNIRPRFIHAAVIFVEREVFGPIEVTART